MSHHSRNHIGNSVRASDPQKKEPMAKPLSALENAKAKVRV